MSSHELSGLKLIPWVFSFIAAGFALFAFWPEPETRAADIPLNLEVGSRTVVFHPKYSEKYLIGVEMNQAIAMRLFPCTADPYKFGSDCHGAQWPLDIQLELSSTAGKPVPLLSSLSHAGGRYGSRETFTLDLAQVDLTRDETYQLRYRMLKDGAEVAPTQPRLVIEVEPLNIKDRKLNHLAALCLAILATAAVLLWMIIATALRYIRRKTNR